MDTYRFLDTVWYEDKIYGIGEEADLNWPVEVLRTSVAARQIELVKRSSQHRKQLKASLSLTEGGGDVKDSGA